MKYLTQKDIEFYNQNGYILVDNVLSKEEITELSDVTDTFVEKSRSVTENNEDFVLEPGHTAENPKLYSLGTNLYSGPERSSGFTYIWINIL